MIFEMRFKIVHTLPQTSIGNPNSMLASPAQSEGMGFWTKLSSIVPCLTTSYAPRRRVQVLYIPLLVEGQVKQLTRPLEEK